MGPKRIPLVAGNWKMNFDHLEATYFVQQLAWNLRSIHFDYKRCEIALMPSFTSLRSVQVAVESDNLKIRYGAQAVSVTSQGAFTGDVSADMIAHLGCSYVIVGHSERRKYHPEDDANIVDQVRAVLAAGMHILKLNIGNPAPFGFRTPDEVVYDMSQQLPDTEGYSPSKGLFSARKAIMQYAQLKNIPNVSIDDIYTGNGVSELINLSLSALLDNGDEVLVPSPDYPLWTACVNLAGGTAVHYVCDEDSEWYPDIDDMRSKITDKTKAIVIINPNNPTGALYPKEVLQQIVDLAREHQLMIFSDEIYDRLVMDGLEHISIASLAPDLFCVTFSGLSKSHMIAGWRVGWMVLSGNKRLAKDYIEGLNMLANMRMCSNVPAQSVVQTALGGHQSVKDYLVPGGRIYDQRELVYNMLNDIPGITAVKPKAAFYIFPKIDVKKFNIHSDEQFALDLLHDKHILISHGGAFNWQEPDHFRVVYLPRISMLKETIGEIGDFFSTYWQA